MPFDGLVKTHSVDLTRRPIDVVLARLGIQPVPNEILEQHKAEQVDRHPASLFYRRPMLHRMAVLTASVGAIASAFVFMSYNFIPSAASIAALTVLMTCLMATAELVLFARIKQPAAWRETLESFDTAQARASVPPPLLNLVDQIGEVSGGVRFALGTLYQEHVALDPYIIAETYDALTRTTSQACLGIWDGDRIVHLAKQS
jgi:hypothetical protein